MMQIKGIIDREIKRVKPDYERNGEKGYGKNKFRDLMIQAYDNGYDTVLSGKTPDDIFIPFQKNFVMGMVVLKSEIHDKYLTYVLFKGDNKSYNPILEKELTEKELNFFVNANKVDLDKGENLKEWIKSL
jgi:hypothetical protein